MIKAIILADDWGIDTETKEIFSVTSFFMVAVIVFINSRKRLGSGYFFVIS